MRLKFENNTFKIMQIADVQEGEKSAPIQLLLMNAALDKESPI